MFLVMAVVVVAVVARLMYVQGLSAGRYAAVGQAQLLHTVTVPALRGSVVDRNGEPLAMSVLQTTIVADPHQVADPRAEAAALAPILGSDPTALQQKLSQNAGFVYLARAVDDNVASRVKALRLPGLTYLPEPKRFLPQGDLAGSVIGQVGTDGHGLGGVEYQKDGQLAGHPGTTVVERDPNGRQLPGGRVVQSAQPGQGEVLTIDRSLQFDAEQALSNEIVTSNARGGVAVLMDSRSGDILAMANMAAGANGAPPVQAPTNTALTNVYEPGSVTKVVTIGGALQNHVVTPDQRFSVPDSVRVAGSTFHDAESHPTQSMSVSDILAQSSNVGTIGIAQQLGKDQLASYLRDFGLGKRTGLGFPGESAGLLLDPAHESGTDAATVPIGQGEAVTAVQMLDAYNAVANGGSFVPPRLVRATIGSDGTQHAVAAQPPHRIISQGTARQLTTMLQQVVQSGTGTTAALSGYSVAGKTGTAQKPNVNGPGYQPGAYMATFVGFVPAQHPALTAIVVLDQPTPIFGGTVAAPVFAQIAQYELRRLGVPPAAPPAPPAAARPATPAPSPGGTSTPPTSPPTTLPGSSTTRHAQ
ncbi:MAG TPA: penicillin-binding protein 2 [Acidimicrobiales bacterium]|jgi:cell division protein FtsI (penicillin-binding protein 3)